MLGIGILLPFIVLSLQPRTLWASVYVLRNVPFGVIVASFEDIVSRFGPELFHLDGFLVVAKPIHACESILPPAPAVGPLIHPVSSSAATEKLSSLPYIALIERGGCDFDLKVLNAQIANYSGVVVYNTVANEIFPMGGRNHIKDVYIPAVMVDKIAGEKLKTFAVEERQKEFVVSLVSFYSLPLKYVLLSLLVLVGISLIILIVCFAAHLCNLWRRMRRGRLSRWHLRRLQTKLFEKAQDPYETCPICLEDYKEREKIRLLPCHHAFHTRCIDPWLLRNRRRCPVCNQTVELPGAPAPEDVVLAVHEPIRSPSLLTRIQRLRMLFVHTDSAVRRERANRMPSLNSAGGGPAMGDEDEERAPLLEQNESTQTPLYSTNMAYSSRLVNLDEFSTRSSVVDESNDVNARDAPACKDDDELLRLHASDSTSTKNPAAMESNNVGTFTGGHEASKSSGDPGTSHGTADDDQLLSDVGTVSARDK